MKKILLALVVLALLFIGIKGYVDNNKEEDINLGDYNEPNLALVTERNKRIVLENMNEENFLQYYVLDFKDEGMYDLHSYCYYANLAEYYTAYAQGMAYISDYNENQFMIKFFETTSWGTYDDILNVINNEYTEGIKVVY